jgi:hypothetical protein
VRKLFIFDTVSGANAFSVPFVKDSLSWKESRNTPDSISAVIPAYDERLATADLFNTLLPLKRSMAVVEDGVVRSMGIITRHPGYDKAARRLSISAVGPEYLLKRRLLLRPNALEAPWTTTVLDDKGEPENVPNPEVRVSFKGQDWPTMVSNMIRTATGWEGFHLPIRYPQPGRGSHDREFDAIDAVTVGEAINKIRDLENGPEIEFGCDMIGDEFRWVLRVGDDEEPRVTSDRVLTFTETGKLPSVRGVEIETDSEAIGSRSWGISGDVDDLLLSVRADRNLIDDGVPLLDIVDTGRRDIVDQRTLDSYTEADLRNGQRFGRFFSFDVNVQSAKHRINDIRKGDWCNLKLKADNYIPGGTYLQRIAEVEYKGGLWARVTTDGASVV